MLLGCAFFAGYGTFGFAFAIGDGDGQVNALTGAFLIGTLVGGVSLAIAPLAREHGGVPFAWSHS